MPKMEFANIEDQYRNYPNLKRADVLSLLQWCSMQPHFPKVSELEAAIMLHSCYGSNEAAKECTDNYLTCRTHCPEFFADCDPNSDELQRGMDTIAISILPKLTPKGELIVYSRLLNTNPDFFNFNSNVKIFNMIVSLYLYQNGCYNGHIFIIDLAEAQLMHLLKISVLSLKKVMYYLQNAAPLRLVGVHFVNGVSFMDKILTFVKPFMKKELQEKLHIHYGNNETILKFIPKDCLPSECGGDCGSVRDIFATQRKEMEKNSSFFVEQEKQLLDESKRPEEPKNAGDFFGMEGTFKKLDID